MIVEAARRAFGKGNRCAVIILRGALVCVLPWIWVGCPAPDESVDTDLPAAAESKGDHLLRFVHLTDVHITDEESPARLVRFTSFHPSAWRPQEAYSCQVLDAMLRAVNARHTLKSSDVPGVDFLLVTGDVTDNAQCNELGWFLDVMDGGWVLPDSGDPDGEERAISPEDNPNLGFQAAGLSEGIPWYSALGNHDSLAVGTFHVDRTAPDPLDWVAPMLPPLAEMLGFHDLIPPTDMLSPVSNQSPAVLLASEEHIDPVTMELELDEIESGFIVPDLSRRYLSRDLFVERHLSTSSGPSGHGFGPANVASGHAYYAVRPDPNVPIRLIVLDTTSWSAVAGLPTEYGVMPRDQFEGFLRPQIAEAQANGEFVLIASHHPSECFDIEHLGENVGMEEFRGYLASQPNVIAHVCGHMHRNRVTPVEGPYPYYEVETASLIDYPQEARVFDVFYDEETGTLWLESEMMSHLEIPSRLAAESYRRASIIAGTYEGKYTSPIALSAEERQGRSEERSFSAAFSRGLAR